MVFKNRFKNIEKIKRISHNFKLNSNQMFQKGVENVMRIYFLFFVNKRGFEDIEISVFHTLNIMCII